MNSRTIFLRFDIDTITCIEQGVPRLIRLAADYDIHFTFFANMGRSISRVENFLRTPARTAHNLTGTAQKISVLKKLGVIDILRTVLFNPQVGFRHLDRLKSIADHGHELGLHGGDNHAVWQRNADQAGIEQIRDWLLATHDRFSRLFGPPVGFASPGTTHSDRVYEVLRELGYAYVSDILPNAELAPYPEPCGLLQIPVNVHRESIPLIEHLRALQLDDDTIVNRVVERCDELSLCTMVAHPVWEGFRDEPLLRRVIEALLERGYQFRPMRALLAETPELSAAR